MNELPENESPEAGRWVLLRDLGVLQVKLVVDGLRDLILVPASLFAGVASLVSSRDGKPGLQFYHLLSFGKQTETWINLFGGLKNSPEEIQHTASLGDGDIDELVRKLESFVVDERKRGDLTRQAKQRLDKILDALQRKNREG